MFAIHKATNADSRSKFLEIIHQLILPCKKDFHGLELLFANDSDLKNSENARILIKSYEKAMHLYGAFKNKCSDNLDDFIEIMQDLGDEIRKYGQVQPDQDCSHNADNMLILPEAIRRLIKAYRVANKETHFVIDAFRNPYEVEYFKRRYSEFYLVAIQRPSVEIKQALKNLSSDAVDNIQERERGKKVEEKTDKNISEWITSQNIEECLQKADIFIENVPDRSKTYPNLRYHLLRFITLAKLPGVVPPSSDERNMQMAMTARQNSGCLSRHVGAVVVGKDGFILGVGWNDPPLGQVPCTLRTASALVHEMDEVMFSEYERSDVFVTHIAKKENKEFPFCFKDEYKCIESKSVNEFTRALHAEENALLRALANSNIEHLENATIYTTDSPCTLCSKKAYHLGISRIVYIEEYPGIAIQQTLCVGDKKITLEQFQGITGSAYFRLFSSLMNEKDFLKLGEGAKHE